MENKKDKQKMIASEIDPKTHRFLRTESVSLGLTLKVHTGNILRDYAENKLKKQKK